jgi:hypothetical protein
LNHYLKRVLSGVVGKLHEHHTETGLGDYFNPIYHSVITTAVRLRVGQLIYENQALDNIVRVNTDGLIADRALTIPTGKGLGKWRFVPPQATIVLSPELVFYGDKRPNSMTYATLRSLICKHPRSSLYEAKFNRRVTLLEAMRDKDLSRVGENITCSSHVDLTMLAQTQVRSFLKFPKTGEALIENKYKSEPIRIDIKPKLK